MADYKGLTIKFTGDDTDLTRALMNIKSKADETQSSLTLIGSGRGLLLKQGGDALKSFGDGLSRLGDKLTIISGAMLLTFGRKMVQDVQEFGNEVSKIGGYLNIDGEQLEVMRELALKFGKDTQYSATEAAEAISELAKGGLTEAQIAGGALEATLHLAAAGQMNFADAAKTTSQALHAFRLEGEDAEHVADALAGAATNSVASVQGLSTGFSYAASWARNAGWSVNEVSGALALLSNYGIDAEMAGTALRNVMLRLAAPTAKAAGIMEDYGIEVRDAYGNMKSSVEVVDELNNALGNLTSDERDAVISAIFGVRGANAALALMDAGSAELQKYIGYTYDVGAAARMAQAQMGDLGWAIELMRGEAETASVNFMSSLEPTLIKLANAAEDLFSWFNELSEAERDSVVNMVLMTVGVGPLLSVFGRIISVVGSVASTIGSATIGLSAFMSAGKVLGASGLERLGAAFSAMKMVSFSEGVELASTALLGMSTAITGVGVAIGALFIGSFIKMLMDIDDNAKRAAERVRLIDDASSAFSDSAKRSAPSLERTSDAYRAIGDAADTSAEHIDELLQSHLDLAEQIENRNNGAQDTIDLLATAKGYVDQYAGAEHLAADEAAKLQWALDIVNQETGHSYELMYAYSGVVGENGEAVDNLTESLDELIDARMREAQAAAISANMTDLYKEKYELEREKAATDTELARLHATAHQIELDMAEEDRYSQRYKEMSNALDDVNGQISELEQSADGLNRALDDNAEGIAFYTDEYGRLYGELDSVEKKLAFIKQAAGTEIFGGLGDRAGEFVERIDAFNQKLSESGQAQIDYTQLTASQWEALVTALNADGYKLEDMLALVTGNLDLASSDWRGIIEQWAADNGVTTEQAMAAISEGIKNGEVDVSNGLQGVLESSVGLAKEKASQASNDAGKDTVEEIADGMTSEEAKKKAEQAAATVLRVIGGAFKKTQPMAEAGTAGGVAYGNGFTSPTAKAITGGSAASLAQFAVSKLRETGGASDAGGKLVGEYKSGIEGSASTVASATEYVKSIAQSHLDSNGKSYEWGKHLVENFADGIEDSTWRVSNATSEIERVVALKLKHSKPKTGLLADDDVWGLHFVQNFASGIDKGIPLLERSVDGMTSTLGWGVNDQSLYMSAGSGSGSGTAIYVDGNAIVTDARLQAASENFMRELARKADM